MRILVVDDIATNRKLLRVNLEAEGHSVIEAQDGAAALELLERQEADAIISDVLMPKMDGYRFCQSIRAHPTLYRLPFVIYTSTYRSPGDKKLAELAGADFYIVKPAPLPVILEALSVSKARAASREVQSGALEDRVVTKEYNSALVRKLEERNLELEQRSQLATLSAEVALALNRGGDLRETLQACAESIVKNLDAAFARVWTFDPKENLLLLQASAGLHKHLDGPHGKVRIGQFKIGKIAQERKAHLTNAVIGDRLVAEQEWAKREGLVAFAGYPLVVDDRLVGVVAMFSRQELSPVAFTALGTISDSIALGIQRKRIEEEMRSSEQRFREIAENIQEVFWIADAKRTHLLYISPGFEKVWGRSRDDLYRDPGSWFSSIHCDDRERVIQAARAGQSGGSYDEEYRINHPDGSVRWIRDRACPVRSATGEIERLVGVARDITEQRALEEQFRQSQKMEAIGQLAGGVAHDFNNILSAIIMQCELQSMTEGLSSEVADAFHELTSYAQRAANLTRQLLLFSRRQTMQPRTLDLNEIVTGLTKMLQRIIGEDIHLQWRLFPNPLLMRADAGMIDQLVMNFAVNSRDAMPKGGRLLIETGCTIVEEEAARRTADAKPGRHIWLSVSDSGTGISPEVLPRIFEPFFTTKEAGKGTGLGLATVFGIVKQHQGWIEVKSEWGKGTTFRAFFPALDESTPSSAIDLLKPESRGGNETILLVEDERSVRELTRVLLTRHGYNVIECANGAEALSLWAKHRDRIRLLLTDLVMPAGISGLQLARQLQTEEQSLKIIFTSGYSTEVAGSALELHRGENFIQKPCLPEELLRAIRQTLDS